MTRKLEYLFVLYHLAYVTLEIAPEAHYTELLDALHTQWWSRERPRAYVSAAEEEHKELQRAAESLREPC